MDLLAQPWWSYVTVSIGFFFVCLGLNYAVKKMNEARMGERLVRVPEKSSVTQCTHVNGPVITVPSEGETRAISMRPPQAYSPPAISLVFDKEENKRIGDVYNMVKPLTDWNRDPSLTTDTKSLETIKVLPISSDHTLGESSPIKKIECELITAKATSSHTFSEKVLIKYDSYDRITPKKSPERNPPEIPVIAGSNTNSVTAKEPGRIIRETLPNDTVAENNSFSNICAGRMIPTNTYTVENTVKNTKVITGEKSREKNDTGCLDSLKSKIAIFNNINDDTRIEKSANLSNRNVTKISSVEKMESKEISPDTQFKQHVREYASIRNSVKNDCRVTELKNTPSNERSSSNANECVPIKTSELGRIVARQTALLTRSDTNVTVLGHALENAAGRIVAEATPTQNPIRTSEFGFLAAEETSNRRSDDNVLETHTATPPTTQSVYVIRKLYDGSIKKTESGSINVKETSNIQTEMNVPDKDIVQMDGPRRTAVEEKSLRKLVLAKNCIEVLTITTSGSGSIVARETASRTLSGPDVLNPIKMSESGSIAAKEIYTRQSEASAVKEESLNKLVSANNATDIVIIKTSESGSIVARETASLTLSGPPVPNPYKIRMSESGSIVVKEDLSEIQSEDPICYE